MEQAKSAGCEWLHVDYEDELTLFYVGACHFHSRPRSCTFPTSTEVGPLSVRPRVPSTARIEQVFGQALPRPDSIRGGSDGREGSAAPGRLPAT
jgi:hypothetical protein